MQTIESKDKSIALDKNTPLMEQYLEIKEEYQDALLLFQVGDFYELFYQDAKIASNFLAITLTKRGKNRGEDIPLCGIPVHALNHYLLKLIKGGFKVAICDQLTQPKPGTVVRRGVTKVLTPGTLTDSLMLNEKSASYLLSLFPGQKQWGLIFSELLTAQLFAVSIPSEAYRMIDTELVRFSPDEVVLPTVSESSHLVSYLKQQGFCTSSIQFTEKEDSFTGQWKRDAISWIETQFASNMLKKLKFHEDLWQSLQIFYFYLKHNQEKALNQFKTIQFYEPEDYLILDSATQKNLEIIKNNQDGGRKNSLFFLLDKAKTPMGSRIIKKWLQRPLIQKASIVRRQEAVAFLSEKIDVLQMLEDLLIGLADLERIIGRIGLARASVNDYLALKDSLKITPQIKQFLQTKFCVPLSSAIAEKIGDFDTLINLLQVSINDGDVVFGIIKKGFDLQLDRLRDLVLNGKHELVKLEKKEIAQTGITSLKVSYNQVIGYFIEITNPNLSKIPQYYVEVQKLVNRKRFTTSELKKLEAELFRAQNEIDQVEATVFDRVKKDVEGYLPMLRQVAQALSYLDGLFGLAKVSYENNYVKPEFNDARSIIIKDGKHPVVEQICGSSFVPNNTEITDEVHLWIITGPNMGGKSTYLRQVALICIMAQCGSLVPAKYANLSVLDRIFTRIGAGDNLAEGKSTFLVEMEETATICTQATSRSLVILDEVGRGTSTFDGIALAQAIIEYISQKVQARCLFATHYHELTQLAKNFSGITNYNMACEKVGNRIVFLHKIVKGVSSGSFGIEVAKLAQLPDVIIKRALQVLNSLTVNNLDNLKGLKFEQSTDLKCEIYGLKEELERLNSKLLKRESIIVQLENINLEEFSPKQTFDLLWNIKQKLKKS